MKKKKQKIGPKILLYDIEIAPILGYVWQLWDNNVALNQIKSDWYVLSWSAKWLGDPPSKTMYMDQRNVKNIENDKDILQGIWKLLDECDIAITQNGVRFDNKKLNARFILNGMKPPSSYRNIDTLQIAKNKFAFTSNKLEYLSDKLSDKYKKKTKRKFSGFDLWKECLAGNKRAWKEMELYNRMDVLALEDVYKKLAPWDTTINMNVYHDKEDNDCSACGSKNLKRWGYRFTNTGKFQRYICSDCGAENKGTTNLLTKEKKKALKA